MAELSKLTTMITENLQHVTPHNPCPHCGKPDWCYFLGNLTVCKRDAEPASGWKMTSKQDEEGSYYYAPEDKSQKTIRPAQTRTWEYPDRDGNPLVRVVRIDDGKGGKPKRWQEHWNGQKWVKGLKRNQTRRYPYLSLSGNTRSDRRRKNYLHRRR